MTETYTDSGALVTWSTPQCPFSIEYSRKALDDIRLAVVDAFFSMPRGGAEIGGVLLGRFDGRGLQILDYAPLECEHAFGPAFTLSAKDQARLTELITELSHRPGNLQPVGWYHSHTRSEICLSPEDLEIHTHFFPEHWQVALVLRPSTLHPTQAGFFFREADGSIHAGSSYQDFTLEAQPVPSASSAGPEAVPGPMRETEPHAVVMELPAASAVPSTSAADTDTPPSYTTLHETQLSPVEESAPESHYQAPVEPVAESAVVTHALPEPTDIAAYRSQEYRPEVPSYDEPAEPPQPQSHQEHSEIAEAPAPFERHEEERHEEHRHYDDGEDQPRRSRAWVVIAAGVAGLALGVIADQARAHYRPQAVTAPSPKTVITPVRGSTAAPADPALRKQNEDLTKQVAALSQQNDTLRQQNATLSQQNTALTQQQAGAGKQQSDLGKQQAELRQERDDLAKQTAKLKADLGAQTTRAQSLQQQLEEVRRQFQRRRLSAQNADPLPN